MVVWTRMAVVVVVRSCQIIRLILKAQSTAFAERQEVVCERKQEVTED